MNILSVINPCTEVYTIFSQRRYLLGVFNENGRDRVFSEILKLIKLFWSLRGWRD